LISAEASGNCLGYSSATLGGMVAASNGTWVTYSSSNGRSSLDIALGHITPSGVSVTWLSSLAADEVSAHLAPYENGLLAAWWTGSPLFAFYFLRLDAAGQPLEAPQPLDAPFGIGDDFYSYPNGDVGW